MRRQAQTTVAATRKKITMMPTGTRSPMPPASWPGGGCGSLRPFENGAPSHANLLPTMPRATNPESVILSEGLRRVPMLPTVHHQKGRSSERQDEGKGEDNGDHVLHGA